MNAVAERPTTSAGSSPKPSYVRPQRTSCGTATTGPKSQRIPVAAISAAVACPIRSTRAGSCGGTRGRPGAGRSWRRRRCCGRGPRRRRTGSGSRAASRARRPGRPRPSRTSRPASFGVGAPPPPLSTEPSEQVGDALRVDRALLELGHLADLLVDRHLGEQGGGAGRRAAGSGRASRPWSRRSGRGSAEAPAMPVTRRRGRRGRTPRRARRRAGVAAGSAALGHAVRCPGPCSRWSSTGCGGDGAARGPSGSRTRCPRA